MLLRDPVEADFAAVAELTNRFIRDTAVHFGYEPLAAGALRAAWEEERRRYPWVVAEAGPGGAFLGYAKAGPWRTRQAYAWSAETTVYVVAGQERRGVGRALYGRLLEGLRARGFHAALGCITLPNHPSVALHEALGFAHVGTFPRAGWKFGRWHDVGFWQLLLRGPDHRPEGPPGAG